MEANMIKLFLNNIFLILVFISFIISCGGGGDDDSTSSIIHQTNQTQVSSWKKNNIIKIEAGGLLTPQLKSYQDLSNQIHFMYFENAVKGYNLRYGIFDLKS